MAIFSKIAASAALVASIPIAAAGPLRARQEAGITLPSVSLTYYYDAAAGTDGGVCYKEHVAAGGTSMKPDWAAKLNASPGACAIDGETLAGMNNENLVAIDVALVSGDNLQHCGKELILYDPSGKEVQHNGQRFIVWDACPDAECGNGGGLDMSAAAIRSIDPAACTKGRLPGYKAVITDKVVLKTAAETRGNRPEAPGGYAASGGAVDAPPASPQAPAGPVVSEYPQTPVEELSKDGSAPEAPTGGEAPPAPLRDGPAGGPPPAAPNGACTPAVSGSPCWTDGAAGCAAGVAQVCTAAAGQPGTFVWQAGAGTCAC